jgi:hypothetical protein
MRSETGHPMASSPETGLGGLDVLVAREDVARIPFALDLRERTATSYLLSCANCRAAITSAADVHRAITAGRLSIIELKIVRASSYCAHQA